MREMTSLTNYPQFGEGLGSQTYALSEPAGEQHFLFALQPASLSEFPQVWFEVFEVRLIFLRMGTLSVLLLCVPSSKHSACVGH